MNPTRERHASFTGADGRIPPPGVCAGIVALAGTPPLLEPMHGPVDIPWLEPWQWALLAGAGLLAVAVFVRWLVGRLRRRPVVVPPTPREKAVAALAAARATMDSASPYAFSILISDILRTYAAEQFQVAATTQTSPEFLAALVRRAAVSETDRIALAAFLETCDLVKFARADAGPAECGRLLDEAGAFVDRAANPAQPPPLPAA